MNDYVKLNSEYYEIFIPNKFKSYGEEVLKYSTNKVKEYLNFFNVQNYSQKVKGYFFVNRDDFLEKIKEVAGPKIKLPPKWATGCFYGGEAQILLDEENVYDKFYTLVHETFHLLFSKFVYQKNNFDRIIWLDESLATNFDGTTENLIKENNFSNLIEKLINNKSLPSMNKLSFDKGNIKTDKYNAYNMFKVVGRYLIETKTNEELLMYVSDEKKVLEDGNTILEDSLKYFKEKYYL